MKKCTMKMKETRKNDTHIKMLLMEGSPLYGAHKELGKTILTRILETMKVPFV